MDIDPKSSRSTLEADVPTFKLRRLRDRTYTWEIELETDSLADLEEWDQEFRRRYGGDVVACICYVADPRHPPKKHRADCPLDGFPFATLAIDVSRIVVDQIDPRAHGQEPLSEP